MFSSRIAVYGDRWSTHLQEVCDCMRSMLVVWSTIPIGTESARDCELFRGALVHSLSVVICLEDPAGFPHDISPDRLETYLSQVSNQNILSRDSEDALS